MATPATFNVRQRQRKEKPEKCPSYLAGHTHTITHIAHTHIYWHWQDMRLVHCYLPVFRAIIFGATFDATGESTGVAGRVGEGGVRSKSRCRGSSRARGGGSTPVAKRASR